MAYNIGDKVWVGDINGKLVEGIIMWKYMLHGRLHYAVCTEYGVACKPQEEIAQRDD